MKIAFYSSKRERCGISTYTDYLSAAMRDLGHEVEYYSSRIPYEPRFQQIKAWRPDVFHFQHEPSIMPPDVVAAQFAADLRARGVKVFLTLHTENSNTAKTSRALVQNPAAVIMHRPSLMIGDATYFHMPCPTLEKMPDRKALRQKYGFLEDAQVISTVGFLIPWKEHPRIVHLFKDWLAKRPDTYLQVIASPHFNPDLRAYASEAMVSIREMTAGMGDRVKHVHHYPTDQELLERLCLSNLGYVWCPMHTGSTSAAGAGFTSARCPLVATDSTHYAYLGDGVLRTSKDNLEKFVQTVQRLAESPETLHKLSLTQEVEYKDRNYREIARRHLELYAKENA